MSRTIAIGDIHGCSDALKALIDAIQPAADDTIVALGDYVDRGPDSREVISQLLTLGDRCHLVPLLGNHEIMMLNALSSQSDFSLWLNFGGLETLSSYGGNLDNLPPTHIDFLKSCQRTHETEFHIFLHANYFADLDLDDQPERRLFWEHLSASLPPPHHSLKTAVVGHTPQPDGEILDLGHLICIDTGCFAGGWLSALDVQSGQVWQADLIGDLR
jgi:serine/threonine protein phosphatase 1